MTSYPSRGYASLSCQVLLTSVIGAETPAMSISSLCSQRHFPGPVCPLLRLQTQFRHGSSCLLSFPPLTAHIQGKPAAPRPSARKENRLGICISERSTHRFRTYDTDLFHMLEREDARGMCGSCHFHLSKTKTKNKPTNQKPKNKTETHKWKPCNARSGNAQTQDGGSIARPRSDVCTACLSRGAPFAQAGPDSHPTHEDVSALRPGSSDTSGAVSRPE